MAKRKEYKRKFSLAPKSPLSKKDVSDALLAIWDGHSDRLKESWVKAQPYGLTKNEAAKNFARREVYALGIALLVQPPKWDIAEVVEKIRLKPTTRPEALERIFHALFLSLYESDDPINRKERWMMAKDLEYAFRHKVPPEFLCGFLYQSGGRRGLLKKLEDGYIEPGFLKADGNE